MVEICSESHLLQEISDANIYEAITKVKINAKASIEKLGMADLLQKHKQWHKQWDTIPTLISDTNMHDSDDEDEKDEDDEDQTDQDMESYQFSATRSVFRRSLGN